MNNKIYVAGHSGMVGSAIVNALKEKGQTNIIVRTHSELDLTNQSAVRQFFKDERPDEVYLAAAKVGGIYANNIMPAEFIYQNLMIESNVIHESWQSGVNKLLFLGSSCIYPKFASQPINENALLTSKLEPTNEPYAIAKIAGIKLCESYNRQYNLDYRIVMPTNLYGPGDNYHPDNSHVIPALIYKFHNAKINNESLVTIWGSGTARREFLYVDDMVEASIHIMNLDKKDYYKHTTPMQRHINLGYGKDITIYDLAHEISLVVGYTGIIQFDTSKPDGAPQRLLDNTCLNTLGFIAKTNLITGLNQTYNKFVQDYV